MVDSTEEDIPSFTEALRKFVVDEMKGQGLSIGEISRRTGIYKGNLSRYVNGKCGLSNVHLDAVVHAVTTDIGSVFIGIE